MAGQKEYDVTVSAATRYLADQSDEGAGRYVFAYTITIRNAGRVAAQLVSRHWVITDAQGLVQEVRGMGVVGAQPRLKPGESFDHCQFFQAGLGAADLVYRGYRLHPVLCLPVLYLGKAEKGHPG